MVRSASKSLESFESDTLPTAGFSTSITTEAVTYIFCIVITVYDSNVLEGQASSEVRFSTRADVYTASTQFRASNVPKIWTSFPGIAIPSTFREFPSTEMIPIPFSDTVSQFG